MPNKTNAHRHRFNIFDLLLILIFASVAVVLLVLGLRAVPNMAKESGNSSVTYVISVAEVHDTVAAQLKKDQRIYDVETGEEIGVIFSVNTVPYNIKGVDQETGETVLNTVEGKCGLEITVTVGADFDGGVYEANGKVIACGEQFYFRTSNAALNGVCISMKAQKQ